jgi:hypothetical protein
MNIMIRIAGLAALLTFWFAAIGWTVLAVAAPANAGPSVTGAISTSDTHPETSAP